jgi:hypothetical protein
VRTRFQPSQSELRIKRARDLARHGLAVARKPLRSAVERLLGRLT